MQRRSGGAAAGERGSCSAAGGAGARCTGSLSGTPGWEDNLWHLCRGVGGLGSGRRSGEEGVAGGDRDGGDDGGLGGITECLGLGPLAL